jgi:hypothetical protein
MLLSEEPRTLHEIARAMGKSSASIYRPIHRMVEAGMLIPSDTPPTRGTVFRLDAVVREQLDADVNEPGGPGVLSCGQRVLFVGASQLSALYEVLARPKMAAMISWSVPLDGGSRRLLALNRETTQLQLDRLAVALEKNAVSVELAQIGELTTGEQVRGAAEEIVGDRTLVRT